MCHFFSCIITRDGRILFTEGDSHSDIIARANLRDDRHVDRDFQRVEVRERRSVYHHGVVEACVDDGERASWLTDEMLEKARLLRDRINPIHADYYLKLQAIGEHDTKIARAAQRRYSDATSILYSECRERERAVIAIIDQELQPLYDAARETWHTMKLTTTPEKWSEANKRHVEAQRAADERKEELLESHGVHAMWDEYRKADARLVSNRDRCIKRSFENRTKKANAIRSEYIAQLSGIEGYLPMPVMTDEDVPF